MGKDSGVIWSDSSHGFWYGCKKVSAGCANCYAKRDMERFKKDFNTVTRAKGFDKPLKWKESGLVFVNPQSDFFIEAADEWRDDAWEIIRQTPHLTYQILTKRPENIPSRLPADWPLPNVYLGVTAENQAMYNERAYLLSQIPAVYRFVSIEPMLGPVAINPALPIDYVICGGESGPDARPMQGNWPLELQQQCAAAGIPFMFKQWSAPKEGHLLGGKEYLDRMPMV